ncbi:MAG TPA: HisA/HisF-related TIM barrel protein [Candidatus Kapabacteria bacterium]|nr:HisA/HisF-related TIM barrel protein [Candidatus Kapabacteria bacterium]
MLVIPAIELKSDRCVRTISLASNDGVVYSDDPGQMALLWRRENARTLHILDRDGLYEGTGINHDAILEVVATVEIPVQLVSSFADIAECEMWLAAGVYRLFLHDLVLRDPTGVRSLVERFGPSRICLGAITSGGRTSHPWHTETQSMETLEFTGRAKELGINRFFFTDLDYEGGMHGPNFAELERLATLTGMHVTAAGGVATVEHLWRLQEMEQFGIDSVVIGRAFYENSFPCQQLWRDIEAERRQAGKDWADAVSTSSLRSGQGRPPGPTSGA